ncbi:MAG: SPASM domain-containing protein [Chitinivibrionia bacterium]|nr:SPASM domain-containing protein [Chitinivibrionia bacterium]
MKKSTKIKDEIHTLAHFGLPIVLNGIAFLLRKIKKYDTQNTAIIADKKYKHSSKISKALKYIDDHNRMICDSRLYNTPQSAQEKMDVFKAHCKYIEVEIFSYCNRKCAFCQNAYIDRHSKNIFMQNDVFCIIIEQLASINFSNSVCFHRYNEPLADKIVVERTRFVREKLPNAVIGANSNGDFATKELLSELAEAGMNYLSITRYPPSNKDWECEKEQRKAITEFAEKLGLKYEYIQNDKLKITEFENFDIEVRASKLADIVSNRAASVNCKDAPRRKMPCLKPHSALHINYDGSINPCCHTRSDVKAHKFMDIGNIREMSIFDAFSSEKYCLLRYMLKDYGDKKIFPCNVCTEPRIYS